MKLYRKRSERRPWEENESEGAVPWLFVLPSLLAEIGRAHV